MGGLNLQNSNLPIGVGEEAAKSIQQRWDTVKDSDQVIAGMGLVDHKLPEFICPELTAASLTTLDSFAYTETYAHLLSWFNYASEGLAYIQARVLQYTNMQAILTAQTRKQQRALTAAGGKKMNEEEMSDQLFTNPQYQEILLELQKAKQHKLLLDAKVDAIERSLRVISRQIEIRKLDVEQSRTGSAMPGRNLREPYTGGQHEPPTLGRPR
jgi:hypothetical protein